MNRGGIPTQQKCELVHIRAVRHVGEWRAKRRAKTAVGEEVAFHACAVMKWEQEDTGARMRPVGKIP